MTLRKLIQSLAVFSMLGGLGLGTIPATAAGASTQDGTTAAVSDDSPSAQVTRLYEAFFLRTPPDADRAFWAGELNSGARTLDDIAEFFATSQEFNDTYGDDLTPAEFVELVYQNVLGRGVDTTFWTEEIEAGRRTRGTVMVGFSESEEFRQRLLARVDDSAIFRLYCAYFGREPDTSGRAFWKSEFANGRPIADIADAFAGAPEYTTLYGDTTNAAFVDTVYLNVLNRPRGASETFWLDQLESGAFTRGRVMIGFSEAPEYAARFASNPPTTCPVTDGSGGVDAPVAVDDAVTTGTGVAVTIDVLVNDTAEDGMVTGASEAANGTVEVIGNSITYTPNTGFTGTDTFTYIVGNNGGTDTGTVTVTVAAGAATANPDEVEGTYNASEDPGYTPDVFTELLSNDTTNGNGITAVGFTDGGVFMPGETSRGGQVTFDPATNEVTYTAPGDFRGNNTDSAQDRRDTFEYTIGTGALSSTTTVSVSVEPREIGEINCGVFLNPPVTGDPTADPVIEARDNYVLFLRSGGCFQPYEFMPGISGEPTLAYTDLEITVDGGTPIPMTATMAGEIAYEVDISGLLVDSDPDTAGDQPLLPGQQIVLTGDLAIMDGVRTLAENTGFTGTWLVSEAGSWVGQSGAQDGITLLVDPFTGDDL